MEVLHHIFGHILEVYPHVSIPIFTGFYHPSVRCQTAADCAATCLGFEAKNVVGEWGFHGDIVLSFPFFFAGKRLKGVFLCKD